MEVVMEGERLTWAMERVRSISFAMLWGVAMDLVSWGVFRILELSALFFFSGFGLERSRRTGIGRLGVVA